MLLKELLEKNGMQDVKELTDELLNKEIKIEGFIPKSRFDEVNTEKNTYKEQVEKITNELEKVKVSSENLQQLKSQVEEFKSQSEKIKSEYETKLKDFRISAEIEKMLIKEQAKYPELIKDKINKENLKITENGVLGLEEEIKGIKEKYTDLFGNTKVSTPSPKPNEGGTINPKIEEYKKLINGNSPYEKARAIKIKNELFEEGIQV